MTLTERIKKTADSFLKDGIFIRRQMHKYPELSFEEFQTTRFLITELEKKNFTTIKQITQTGFYADIFGHSDNGKNILLRADIDALPISEKEGRTYGSCHPGIMHACGHDVHSACVFATALILKELRPHWCGMVRVVFQPGEERAPGGASVMIQNGLLENPALQQAIALHVHPDLPVGKYGFCSGPFMAASDELHIVLHGKGGHAALKNKYINPVPAASHAVCELTDFFSQDPEVVFAIGKILANGATNVIPQTCRMEGTLRTFDENKRIQYKNLIKKIIHRSAQKHGCVAEINITDGYPVLVNNPDITQQCMMVASELFGKESVCALEQRYASEDFAFIAQKIPSCFMRLGTANPEKGITAAVHTPDFDVDERCIYYGSCLLAACCIKLLS